MINTSLNLFFNNFSNFNNNNEIENMIFNSKCIDFRYISYIVENINQNLNKYQLFNSNNITNSEIYYINENSKKSKRYESNIELDGFINKKNKLFDEKFEFIYLKTRGSAVFIKLNYQDRIRLLISYCNINCDIKEYDYDEFMKVNPLYNIPVPILKVKLYI